MIFRNYQNRIAIYLACTIFMLTMTAIHAANSTYARAFCTCALALVSAWMTGVIILEFKEDVRRFPKDFLLHNLRSRWIFRPLANYALRMAGIPTRIPAGAMNALGLGSGDNVNDGSPLEWPVSWNSHNSAIWSRTDCQANAYYCIDGKWRNFNARLI